MRVRERTWIEISRSAIRRNVDSIRTLLAKQTKLFAVVKANGYGHGLVPFSCEVARAGVDGLCIDSIVEGAALRCAGVSLPMLILGPTLPHEFVLAKKNKLITTISTDAGLRAVARTRTPYHIKFDTGMHRQGFAATDAPRILRVVQKSKSLTANMVGVYTHFAAANDRTYPRTTHEQYASFAHIQKMFLGAGFKNALFHTANSGGTLLYPNAHLDAVRVGIALYGYFPSEEAEVQHAGVWGKKCILEPVLSWRSVVTEVKHLTAGDGVGYNLTERVPQATCAAVVPVGYSHGYPRALSSVGEVLIRGKRTHVLGRVSMGMITVAVSPHVRVGDHVTILGKDFREKIYATDIASRCMTIPYEIITRINPTIERVVVA